MESKKLTNPMVTEGHKLIRDFNCQGCHLIDGFGGIVLGCEDLGRAAALFRPGGGRGLTIEITLVGKPYSSEPMTWDAQ